MNDDQILDVIQKAMVAGVAVRSLNASTILAALRDAGYDIVPTDVAKLGRRALADQQANIRFEQQPHIRVEEA